MVKILKVIAECYANKCLAIELKHYIQNLMGIEEAKTVHSFKHGRDRILKNIEKYTQQTSEVIIAVIDYEQGVSRKFIEKQFELSEITSSIYLGIHKQKANIIAIIFDPNIEEAVLCKYFNYLCRNLEYYNRIKSSEACKFLMDFLKKK
ncbi:MAG: hypothetical protein J7L82_01060 [Staphylothermus sp.]|nr:hypothetical protein [Staphylothermus sp.]